MPSRSDSRRSGSVSALRHSHGTFPGHGAAPWCGTADPGSCQIPTHGTIPDQAVRRYAPRCVREKQEGRSGSVSALRHGHGTFPGHGAAPWCCTADPGSFQTPARGTIPDQAVRRYAPRYVREKQEGRSGGVSALRHSHGTFPGHGAAPWCCTADPGSFQTPARGTIPDQAVRRYAPRCVREKH
jgi:hypothetical protein